MSDEPRQPVAQGYLTPAPHNRLVILNASGCESKEQLEALTTRLHGLAEAARLPRGRFNIFEEHAKRCGRAHGGSCTCEPELIFGPVNVADQ